jgi:hypothetical protein
VTVPLKLIEHYSPVTMTVYETTDNNEANISAKFKPKTDVQMGIFHFGQVKLKSWHKRLIRPKKIQVFTTAVSKNAKFKTDFKTVEKFPKKVGRIYPEQLKTKKIFNKIFNTFLKMTIFATF